MSENHDNRYLYLALAAGVVLGAGLVRLVIWSGLFAELFLRIENEVPLGRALVSPDNLTLAGALVGLFVSAVVLHFFLEKKK
jgi:hypothetical protein